METKQVAPEQPVQAQAPKAVEKVQEQKKESSERAAAPKKAVAKKTVVKKAAVKKTPAKTAAVKKAARRPSAGKKAASRSKAEAKAKVLDLDSPTLYINREISWLEFDRKVLETAMDEKVPLLERVKFLSIFFNNLDEFYMVRVMNLQRQARSGVAPTGADQMTPIRQLAEIRRRVLEMTEQAEELWLQKLRPALERRDICFGKYETLSDKSRAMLDKYFDREILPVLTPQAVDAGRPFPMISNTSINFVVELEGSPDTPSAGLHYARLKCPNNVPRFLFIPERDKESKDEKDAEESVDLDPNAHEGRIIMVEDLIAQRLGSLFPGFKVTAMGMFRITRNTDGEIEEDEADDLLAAVRDYVEQRRFGSVVRLELGRGMPQRLQDFLIGHLGLHSFQIYRSRLPLEFADFIRLTSINRPALKYPPFVAKLSPDFDPESECFHCIRQNDVVVYHPYDSFNSVLRFVHAAAVDPKVVAIKQTLYRCGSDSPIVKSLLEARKRGKQVTAVVELKARFDEERNINWAEELERAGVNVVYGFAGLKIHAKLCLVVRREKSKLQRYVHIGTGNYNASTAKIYTDLGLFTANRDICDDVQQLFNVMTGFGIVEGYKKLFVSPQFIRPNMLRLIHEEIECHKKTGNGHIILKCNQLVDAGIIRALYEASIAGVKVECIVRGICCLRPGLPGISENITVRAIVGEFLEHARVYWFAHSGKEQMYIGSADMMQRNLNGRIEVLAPVLDADLRRNIMEQIIDLQLADNVHAWVMSSDGSYTRQSPHGKEKAIDSQYEIAKHLHLNRRTQVDPNPKAEEPKNPEPPEPRPL